MQVDGIERVYRQEPFIRYSPIKQWKTDSSHYSGILYVYSRIRHTAHLLHEQTLKL